MDELERQLRDLAAHRASQVPEFDATSLTSAADSDDGHGPNWGALLAVAALIVALLVGGGYLLFGRTDDDTPHVVAAPSSSAAPSTSVAPTTPPSSLPSVLPPPTNPPPTTVPSCPNGNDTLGQSGPGTVTSVPPLAVLQSVGFERTNCIERLTFRFTSTVGSWTIGYERGPLTLEPSGQPVSVSGNAYLVLTFRDTNTSASLPSVVGVESSIVLDVKKIQDFEGVVTWVIGLDATRAFGVASNTPGEITVEIAR